MGQHTLRALFSRDAAIPKTLPISSSTSPDARDGTLPDSGVGPPNQPPGPETAPSPASHMDLDDSRVAPRPAAPGTVPWPNEPTASVPPSAGVPPESEHPQRDPHAQSAHEIPGLFREDLFSKVLLPSPEEVCSTSWPTIEFVPPDVRTDWVGIMSQCITNLALFPSLTSLSRSVHGIQGLLSAPSPGRKGPPRSNQPPSPGQNPRLEERPLCGDLALSTSRARPQKAKERQAASSLPRNEPLDPQAGCTPCGPRQTLPGRSLALLQRHC